MSVQEVFEDFSKNPLYKGVTFSGGEPFCQAGPLAELARRVHGIGKDVVTFTGYTYEQLLAMGDPSVQALLDGTDLLIDGPFLEGQKNLELRFRGSENQRLIDMKGTRQAGRPVILQDN